MPQVNHISWFPMTIYSILLLTMMTLMLNFVIYHKFPSNSLKFLTNYNVIL